jgi:hypothetical protein
MAKKVDIGSKEFTKLLDGIKYSPNPEIIKKLDAKMFALDQNKVYNYKPERLAISEFTRCLQLFESRNPGLKPGEGLLRLNGVQNLIIKAEEPNKTQLQDLAVDTIREIYQVPDYVDLKAFIQPRLNLDTDQDKNPAPFLGLTMEQKNKMRDEIQKRIILNGLVHGSSMHIWKGIYHLVSEELDKINPGLKDLYNYYTSTLGLTIWLINPDEFSDIIENGSDILGGMNITQGYNKLSFNRGQGFGGKVEAKGINFPVLLHEINKGVIDWLISAGIPQDYTHEELRYYYSLADAYTNEPWHYMLGPTLWVELLEAAQVSNEDIPKLISRIVKLSYPEMVQLFRLIQDNKEQATQQIQKWKL